MPFCSNCGTQVSDGMKFCHACGKPIIVAPSAVPTPEPAPAVEPVQTTIQTPTPVVNPEPVVVETPVVAPTPEPIVIETPVAPAPEPVVVETPAPAPAPTPAPVVQNTGNGLNIDLGQDYDMESGEDPEPIVGTYTIPGLTVTPVQNAAPMPGNVPVQNATPVQGSVPVQNAAPVQGSVPVQNAAPVQGNVPVQNVAPQPAQGGYAQGAAPAGGYNAQQYAAGAAPGAYAAPNQVAAKPKKKGKLPLILGIVGGIAALILIGVGVSKVIGGSSSAPSHALSNMLYQAAYNRQQMKGGSSASTGSLSEASGSQDTTGSNGGSGSVQIADYASVGGEIAETAKFSVLVPDGWKAFPVKSTSGDGSMDEYKLNIIKGGTSNDDLWSKNAIKIEVADYNASYSVYLDAFENYEDVELKLGDYTYTGPAGEYSGGWECAMLSAPVTVDSGEGFVAGSVFYKVKDEVISLSDPDVQAILASIKLK